MSHFYLNEESEPRSIDDWPAYITVLDYLRASGHVGTKEGCATGDCGACTAVTVSLASERLQYDSLNTCIALLPMLAGRLLITVDGLADKDGKLHPVQQAMVASHGSQCGFCTPGFVMSLFAHVKAGGGKKREQVVSRLAGNLCRCTGYVPIIEAGLSLDGKAGNDKYARQAKLIKRRLRSLARQSASATLPKTVAQLATSMASKRNPQPVAGGTDLGLAVTQELIAPELAFVGGVSELAKFKATKTQWRLGAGMTWESCDEKLSPHLPGFSVLMERFGSPQIRHRGTVGGNLGNASPIADGPPVFLALGCKLVLRRGKSRRTINLEDFYTGYRQTVLRKGEFIETIVLNRPSAGSSFNVYKVSKRIEDDISSVCGAFFLRLDRHGKVTQVRFAYGGMAAVPLRASRCEKACKGKKWNEKTVDQAVLALDKDFVALTDIRASAAYRQLVAGNLLRRFYLYTQGVEASLEGQLAA